MEYLVLGNNNSVQEFCVGRCGDVCTGDCGEWCIGRCDTLCTGKCSVLCAGKVCSPRMDPFSV